MNTANLQLEGVYAVLAALCKALLKKSVFTEAELVSLLSDVERQIASDRSRPLEVRGSNVEAMCFPARFLKSALKASSDGSTPTFAEVVSRISQTRGG
jgi:hypothetical protein